MSDQPTPRPNGFSEATGEICYDLPSSYLPQLAASIARLLHVGLGLVEPAHAGAEALHGG